MNTSDKYKNINLLKNEDKIIPIPIVTGTGKTCTKIDGGEIDTLKLVLTKIKELESKK